MLEAHPEVAGVCDYDHFGIHESIFFSHFARAYGDLEDDANFARFAADFAASDYYVLSGIEPDWIRRRRPRSYPEAFRLLMDEFARRRGARFWLEKSPAHTLLARTIASAYPDARFVCIQRRGADVIRSRFAMPISSVPPFPKRLVHLVNACANHALYARTLEAFAASCPRSILLGYEELRSDPDGCMRRVCAFLGLEFDPAILTPRSVPNTSFDQPQKRKETLSRTEEAIIENLGRALRRLPLGALSRMYEAKQRRRGVEWPEWCWRRQPRPSGLGAEPCGAGGGGDSAPKGTTAHPNPARHGDGTADGIENAGRYGRG